MKLKLIALFFLFIAFYSPDIRAETSIKAEVDKAAITTDETVVYKLMITSSEKKIPAPDFPGFNEFIVLSQAQTSEISISKGEGRTFVVYVFILAPARTGRLKISSAHIRIGQEVLSSDSFEVEVTQGKSQIQPGPGSEKEQTEPQKEPLEPAQSKITL